MNTFLKSKIKSKKGFALIELMIVMAIIVILATIILVVTQGARARSRDGRRKADLDSIKKAIELYRSDNGGNVPLSLCAGTPATPCVSSSGGSTWIPGLSPTYITTVPQDPTNASPDIYRYAANGTTDYELDARFEDASNNGLEVNDNGDCNIGATARWERGTTPLFALGGVTPCP